MVMICPWCAGETRSEVEYHPACAAARDRVKAHDAARAAEPVKEKPAPVTKVEVRTTEVKLYRRGSEGGDSNYYKTELAKFKARAMAKWGVKI